MIYSRVRTSCQLQQINMASKSSRPPAGTFLSEVPHQLTDQAFSIPFKPSRFRHIITQCLYPFHHYLFQLLILLTFRWPLVYFLPHPHVRPIVSKQFSAVLSLFKLSSILSFWSISPLYVPFLGHLTPLFSNPPIPFWSTFYGPFRPLNSAIPSWHCHPPLACTLYSYSPDVVTMSDDRSSSYFSKNPCLDSRRWYIHISYLTLRPQKRR